MATDDFFRVGWMARWILATARGSRPADALAADGSVAGAAVRAQGPHGQVPRGRRHVWPHAGGGRMAQQPLAMR